AAGIRETAEAAHRALVSCGIWTRDYNPWPIRASCSLKPPKAEFPETESPLAHRARTDLREHRAYAIDAAWSTDPDDAVSAFDGFFWVHVADPAAYIEPGSEADEEACERGATLYLPEKVVPMLPERAVDMLGLGLAEESKALSFGIRLDDEGRISETRILPSIVRVSRLSYTEADLRLGSGDTLLETLDRAATARRARRMANGAIEINLPEVSIAVEKGNPRFVPIEPTRSGEIVREMMLMAGEAAAAWAIQMRVPFVYASQEGRTESGDDGQAEPALLSAEYKKRKSMRAGGFGVEPLAHRGLGLPFYSQVTSPLRRYQDLLTHQQIRRVLASQPHLDEDELARRCLIASRGAASTRQAERDSRLHWTIRYLERHPEWVSEAVVLEAREGGAWILIPEMGLECRLATRLHLEEDARIRVGLLSSSLSDLEIVMEQRP
ncbi:MAG TPA: RNB domain-containing ribonuclease, partial [Rectinemataceae bacterium]